MAIYRIGVIERYERIFTVEADSEEAALQLAAKQSENDEGELFEYHSTTDASTWNVTPVVDEA